MPRQQTYNAIDRLTYASHKSESTIIFAGMHLQFLFLFKTHYSVVKHGDAGVIETPSHRFIKFIEDLVDPESLAALQLLAENQKLTYVEKTLEWPARSARTILYIITSICVKHLDKFKG